METDFVDDWFIGKKIIRRHNGVENEKTCFTNIEIKKDFLLGILNVIVASVSFDPKALSHSKNKIACNLGSVYIGPDLLGTDTKLVWISFVFTWDLLDLVGVGSAIWYNIM